MKKVFTIVGTLAAMAFSHAQIVINEVYTGGGLLGAAITNDFVELKNIGTSVATLSGATIQYGPASGAFTNYYQIPNISLNPGQTYLISQGSDGVGGIINLLNPNLIINVVLGFDGGPAVGVGVGLAFTSGKVALASDANRVTGPQAANVLDFVGYGLADQYEGTGAAPSPTILNSISRISGDTNNNNVDFRATLPTPQSSGTLATGETPGSKAVFIKNTMVRDHELLFGSDVKDIKIYTYDGRMIKSVEGAVNQRLNISDLPAGNYIVVGQVNGKAASQKIVKK